MKADPKKRQTSTYRGGLSRKVCAVLSFMCLAHNYRHIRANWTKLSWFTLEFAQKFLLVVENEPLKVGDNPRFSKSGKFEKSLYKSLRISLVYIRIYKGISRISPICKIEEDLRLWRARSPRPEGIFEQTQV